MNSQILGYTVVMVILANCLMCTANSKYAIGNIDDIINKRRYQRRNLLESFCARRCNIGRGGNVCKCNGFHFAGKRTSGLFEDSNNGASEVSEVSEVPHIYGVLSDAEKLLLNPDRDQYNDIDEGVTENEQIDTSLNTILTAILKGKIGSRRTYDDALKELIDTYLTTPQSEGGI